MKRYFVFFFKEGKVFVETNDGVFPCITDVQDLYEKEDKAVYSIFEFKNLEDYVQARVG